MKMQQYLKRKFVSVVVPNQKRCIKKQGQDERTRGAAQQLALGNNWQAVIKEWKNGGHCSNGGFQFTGKPGVKVMPSDPRI